jgi:photosystem II stability/assembly factor-like uncharacterized protein
MRNITFSKAVLLAITVFSLGGALPTLAENQNSGAQQPAVKSMKVAESLLQDITRVGDRLVAVGERGHIIWSDNNGKSWQQADVPTRQMLNAVFFISPDKGWAVGHDGLILVTQDGGQTWAIQLDGLKFMRQQSAEQRPVFEAELEQLQSALEVAKSALEAAEAAGKEDITAEENALNELDDKVDSVQDALDDAEAAAQDTVAPPLMDIWFADENAGFAVGAFGQFLKTTDGGATWESIARSIDNEDRNHLNGITGRGNVLFIAAEAGKIYRSTDAGASWTLLPSPDPENGSFFTVTLIGEGRQAMVLGLRGAIYRTNDLGATWKMAEENLHKNMNGVFSAGDLVLAVGNDGALLRSRNQGIIFKDYVQEDRVTLTAVVEAADGSYVIVGASGVKIILPASL